MNSFNNSQFTQKEIKQAKELQDVINYATWHLGRRDHSSFELKEKLYRKTDNEEWIDETIKYLKDSNYLNDRRFVEYYLKDCYEYKQYGPTKIKQELKQKGIEKDLIDEITEELEIDYFELAVKCLNKKQKQPIEDRKDRDRLTRFLLTRGFSFDMIRYAFEEHLKEEDDDY
ncbi:MAG: regulatory protein RecX [Candidatus Sericytochromatia bacterium]